MKKEGGRIERKKGDRRRVEVGTKRRGWGKRGRRV